MKDPLFIVLASISIIFAVVVLAQSFGKSWKTCALCIGVSLTWIIGLILAWNEQLIDPIFFAVLVGSSVTGLTFFAVNRLPERFHTFRLPFFLTLTIGAYALTGASDSFISSIIFVGLLWIIFLVIYAFRTIPKFKSIAARLIACCKNW